MRRARQRGSVCIYVAVCLLSLGLLTAAIVPLATGLRGRTTRRTDELRARLAFEAGVALVKSQSLTLSATLGTAQTVTMNGATATVTPTANDTKLAKSLLLTGTATRNERTYRFSRVVGPRVPSPFCFALFDGSDLDAATLTTGAGGADGDVYTIGKVVSHAATGLINGSLFSTKTIVNGGVVTGRTVSSATAVPWPDISASDYQTEAYAQLPYGKGFVIQGNQTLTSLTFATATDGVYPILYYAADLNLKGTISGRGTVFVKGTLTISGNLRYASANDEVAFVCSNSIVMGPGVSAVDGLYYAAGKFALGNTGLTVSRGVIVTKDMDLPKPLTIVRDNVARDDSDEATRLRLPYYWPAD